MTLVYALLINWYQNSQQLFEHVWNDQPSKKEEPADILIYDAQKVNLMLLLTFDFRVMRNILFTWLAPLILTYLQIYIFKRF